ncbi:MAG: response regulator [Aggregatilineales bacterium]
METVLIVEDYVVTQEMFAHVMEVAGFKTISFDNGDDALEYLKTETDLPKVMLLDINLPGVSGVQLVQYLRHTLNRYDIKVIMLTANVVARENLDPYLADEIMTKPVSVNILKKEVQRLMSEYKPPAK